MAITHYIPDGTTEAQVFQATIDDVVTDLTGSTLSLDVVDNTGTAVALTGTVAWDDASLSRWSYTPDGQLTKALSPYKVRVYVSDGSSPPSTAAFPNGRDADTWWIVDP